MSRFMSLIVFGLVGWIPSAAVAEPTRPPLPNLVGTWSYTGGQRDGAQLDGDHFRDQRVEISDQSFRLAGDAVFLMDYQLSAGDPVAIDFTMKESPFGAGAQAAGIVELKDDQLRLCYNPTGKPRPQAFDVREGSTYLAFTLKRLPLKPEELLGKWNLVRGVNRGKKISEDRLESFSLEISKEKFRLEGDGTFVMAYDLSTKSQPPSLELTMIESPFGPGGTAKGIIQQVGDKLIFCYSLAGETPTGFTSEENSRQFLFFMQREESEEDNSE